MGIFARLARLIQSNINDLISVSEDPEKMLNQIVIDMNTQLIEAKKHVVASIADEKRLDKQAEQEESKAKEWERRAMLAVRANDDNLAKEALARKKEHETLATEFRDQWRKQKQAVDQLKLALRALNSKIEEAKRKKTLLISRKKRAEAQQAIQATMSGLKNASAFEAYDRMAQRIEQMEAQAEASAELSEEYTGDVLAHKFGQLEVTQGADEDLVALKQRMGILPEPPAAPAPQAVRVASSVPSRVDAEAPLEELSQAEQDELARALADLEVEEQRELRAKR